MKKKLRPSQKKKARRPACAPAKPGKRLLEPWEQKKKPGPVKIEVDPARVRDLARFMYTDEEIAVALGISWATFKNRKVENPEIQVAIDEGKANGRRSLRSKQLETAMKGNVPMQIFLGKQYLDQADKSKIEGEHKHLMTFTPDISKPENAAD